VPASELPQEASAESILCPSEPRSIPPLAPTTHTVTTFSLAILALLPVLQQPAGPPLDADPETPTVIVEPAEEETTVQRSRAQLPTIIDAEQLAQRNYRTLPQALREIPQVMVQETAHGQGSPYLRGFTGYNTLLLVDDIRLNNSVFRSGPNQYWNTVDALSLDRLEVDLGPSSSLFGSGAVGGVVRAYTRSPYGEVGRPSGRIAYEFSEAGRFHIMRAENSFVGENTSVLLGITAKDFGDVHGGREVGLQPGTGYNELDADLKVEHWLDDESLLVFGHLRVDQNNVPRTHKTVNGIDWEGLTAGSDLLRNLDQERELTYLQLRRAGLQGLFDATTTSVSWQKQSEERHRIKSDTSQQFQGLDVDTLQVFHHMFNNTDSGQWSYGVDFTQDWVDSFLDKGAAQTAADDIQGPVADDSGNQTLHVFAQDRFPVSEDTHFIAGASYSRSEVDADSVRDPVLNTRTSFSESYDATALSLQFESVVSRKNSLEVYGGISQGFRLPNLSDLTRFDSARTGEFEIPSLDLEPEKVTGLDFGLRRTQGRARYDLNVFYTGIEDGIQRFPTGTLNGDGDAEITKGNIGDGYVWGWSGLVDVDLTPAWTVHLDAAYQYGVQDTFPTSAPVIEREPIDRLMPFTMHAGIRWQAPANLGWGELMLTHASRADHLSTRDQADTSRIPLGGTPSYSVLDLRFGKRFHNNADVMIGMENLLDEDYRIHGSGVNRPGRGLVFGLVMRF
jgi:hemoglobin/transferrin/lactoferrin receptor protein